MMNDNGSTETLEFIKQYFPPLLFCSTNAIKDRGYREQNQFIAVKNHYNTMKFKLIPSFHFTRLKRDMKFSEKTYNASSGSHSI